MEENIDLFPFNTFQLHATTRYFTRVAKENDILDLIQQDAFNKPHLILGGGSNILLTQDFDGLVIKNELPGIEIVYQDDDFVDIKVGSGEGWHKLVMYCVGKDWGGIENLSLIPGTVGAAPMQNIGAYGVEIKDVLKQVEAIELTSGNFICLNNAECKFGYRESIFKHELKGKYFISSVTLRLTIRNHRLHVSYGAIQEVLKQNGIEKATIHAVSEAVIAIRSSKLPDPKIIGNAGSFFKNPTLTQDEFNTIKKFHSDIPSYPGENNGIKIPAGWLIEQCGWKGKTLNNIGVHKNQALVLVNYGEGKGNEIWALAMSIQESVRKKFNIELQPEVNII